MYVYKKIYSMNRSNYQLLFRWRDLFSHVINVYVGGTKIYEYDMNIKYSTFLFPLIYIIIIDV